MSKQTKQKNLLIAGLLAIVLIMAVGYAAFATQLNINGTANVDSNWCVGFKNTNTNTYVATPGKEGATTPTGSISFSGDTCATNYQTNASLTAAFKQPGDKIVYTLTIGNKSTFAAAIKSIKVENENVTSNKTITKGNIKYTVEMPESTTLAADAETTMKVIAEFQNDTDIEKFTGTETQTLSVQINAQQDDGTGGMDVTPAKYTGTIYRWNTTEAQNGGSIVGESGTKYVLTDGTDEAGNFDNEEACTTQRNTYLGQGMPESYTCQQKTVTTGGVGEYTTNASTLNKTYYLKHDVVDDIITNSYVCFVYNNVEHCMKGGDNGASFAANTQIIQDYQTFYNLPTRVPSPGCYFDSSSSNCYGGGFFRVNAESYGVVQVADSLGVGCSVYGAGISSCNQ